VVASEEITVSSSSEDCRSDPERFRLECRLSTMPVLIPSPTAGCATRYWSEMAGAARTADGLEISRYTISTRAAGSETMLNKT
jgi:hypothetical protein